MNRADVATQIKYLAQVKCTQRTLDGRSLLAKLIEKALLSSSPSNDSPSRSSVPLVSPYSISDLTFSQSEKEDGNESDSDPEDCRDEAKHKGSIRGKLKTETKISNRNRIGRKEVRSRTNQFQTLCCVRLTEDSFDLFKRVHRLFFLNESQDMTLLVLVGMSRIQYPKYKCPVEIYKFNTRRIEEGTDEKEKEHDDRLIGKRKRAEWSDKGERSVRTKSATGKVVCNLEHNEEKVNIVYEEDEQGDESFVSPPPSPARPLCVQRYFPFSTGDRDLTNRHSIAVGAIGGKESVHGQCLAQEKNFWHMRRR